MFKATRLRLKSGSAIWQWAPSPPGGVLSSAKHGLYFWVNVGGKGVGQAQDERIARQAVKLVLSKIH
jgi:hypothetical protein